MRTIANIFTMSQTLSLAIYSYIQNVRSNIEQRTKEIYHT